VRPFSLVGPDDTYDAKEYQKILLKATEELLVHFGYDMKSLEAIVDPSASLSLPLRLRFSSPSTGGERVREEGILRAICQKAKWIRSFIYATLRNVTAYPRMRPTGCRYTS